MSDVESGINLNTHVVIFNPTNLIGAYQVNQCKWEHGNGGKDDQTLDQTPLENATLRSISSHEVVLTRARAGSLVVGRFWAGYCIKRRSAPRVVPSGRKWNSIVWLVGFFDCFFFACRVRAQ